MSVGWKSPFLQHWSSDGSPKLRDMNLILCGEPVWFCPLLDSRLERPMLVRFNMAVLDEFPLEGQDVQDVVIDRRMVVDSSLASHALSSLTLIQLQSHLGNLIASVARTPNI